MTVCILFYWPVLYLYGLHGTLNKLNWIELNRFNWHMCWFWITFLLLLSLNRGSKIVKWHLQLQTKKKYCSRSRDINCISVLNHQTADWSLLPAIFQGLRFGIKLIFSSTREVIERIEGLHSNYDSSAYKTFPFFCIFSLTFMNEHISGQNIRLNSITLYK